MTTLVGPNDCSSGTNFTAVSGHNKGNFSGVYKPGHGDGQCACYESAYGGTWPNDQYAQAKVVLVSTNSGDGAGPLCRHTTGQYYYVRCTTTATNLFKYVSGVRTSLGTGSAVAANSIVKLECNGTAIKVYDDGVEIISTTDSALTGGQAGMYGYGGGSSRGELDDWEAGDLDTGATEIEVPVGTATLTTYDSTISVDSGPVSIPISVGSVATTTYDLSADVGSSSSIPIGSGSQQFTTYAESLNIGFGIPEGTGPEAAFPDDTNVGITGYAVSVGGDYAIGIGVGSVSISTYDLTVSSTQGTFIPVDVGAITTTGYAPIDVSSHVPSPDVATQTITGYVPLIGTSHFRTPDSVEITITGYDVSTAPTSDIYIDISSGAITSASSAPSLIDGTGRAPDTATLGFTGYTPDAISEDVSWEFSIDEGSATYSTYDLTLSIIEVHKRIAVGVGSIVIPGWKLPFGTEPSVEIGLRKRRKLLGFLK